jgi:hypothetical protein
MDREGNEKWNFVRRHDYEVVPLLAGANSMAHDVTWGEGRRQHTEQFNLEWRSIAKKVLFRGRAASASSLCFTGS